MDRRAAPRPVSGQRAGRRLLRGTSRLALAALNFAVGENRA